MNNRFGLAGQIAVITGSAQNIGFEVAQNLSLEGMKIVIADIQQEKGEKAAEQIRKKGGEAEFFYVDLRSAASVDAMINAVIEKHQKIDLLVNNAKTDAKMPQKNDEIEHWEAPLKINLSGAYYCARAVLPHMTQRGSGCIINISSVLSKFITEQSIGYHVAKAGMNQLTRFLACEAGPKGIRVNTVSPGLIISKVKTPAFMEDSEWRDRWEWCHPLKKVGSSKDISNAILFLASELSQFITGHDLVLDGGITLTEPGWLVYEHSKAKRDGSSINIDL